MTSVQKRGSRPNALLRPFRHLVLVLDYREPGFALVDLKPVALQPLGWRMLARLAESPGSVVSYKQLYDDLWGDTVVEMNQLSFQKAGVLGAIGQAAPRRRDLILTFPKVGFMLDLSPREVLIVSPVSCSMPSLRAGRLPVEALSPSSS